jgi:F-type H+-transporting ATPase subunit gamma
MKVLAASSVGQYQNAVLALVDYYSTVEQGLSACFRQKFGATPSVHPPARSAESTIGAIVFGSDQGLVGQFNDAIADYALKSLAALGGSPQIVAVGYRVHTRLVDSGLPILGVFNVPSSVGAIAALVGQIQVMSETHRASAGYSRVFVFHNRPRPGNQYEPAVKQLLPLDAQ